MDKYSITIELQEYKILVEAKIKLNMIQRVAEVDDYDYGYRSETANAIDTILEIERNKK